MATTISNPATFSSVRSAFNTEGYGISTSFYAYRQGGGIVPASSDYNIVGAGTSGDPLQLSQFNGLTVYPSVLSSHSTTLGYYITPYGDPYNYYWEYGFYKNFIGTMTYENWAVKNISIYMLEDRVVQSGMSTPGTLFGVYGGGISITNDGWTSMRVTGTGSGIYNIDTTLYRSNATFTSGFAPGGYGGPVAGYYAYWSWVNDNIYWPLASEGDTMTVRFY